MEWAPNSVRMSAHQGSVALAEILSPLEGIRQASQSLPGEPVAQMFSEAYQTYSSDSGSGVGYVLTTLFFPFYSLAKDDATLSGKRMQSLSLNK